MSPPRPTGLGGIRHRYPGADHSAQVGEEVTVSPGSLTIPRRDSSSPRPTVSSWVAGSSRNRETRSSVWQKYFLLGERVSKAQSFSH